MTPARFIGSALLCGLVAAPPLAPAQAPAAKGIGPFSVTTTRGAVTVYLLRRDKELVWVNQQAQNGSFIETGIAVRDIVQFESPRPRLFLAAEAAGAPEQIEQVRQGLKKFMDQLQPFRDLPGMIVDDAQLLQGGLFEKEEAWAKAAECYSDILAQKYQPTQAETARLRLGLCQARLGSHEQALENLGAGAAVPDDDLGLLSQVYFARGDACLGLGQYDQALLNYLYLVVFHPYTERNEPRALVAALPCYAALTDWDAAYRTANLLATAFQETEEAKAAAEFLAKYEIPLSQQAALTQTYDASEMKEDEGVYDEFK